MHQIGLPMLIDLSFRNFRNFRDPQTLTFRRKGAGTTLRAAAESALTDPADFLGKAVSPVIAVYGANASGKSNLLNILLAVCRLVATSYPAGGPDTKLSSDPYLLGGNDRTTHASIRFIADDGLDYLYELSWDKQKVISERLSYYRMIGSRRSTRRTALFTRDIRGIQFSAAFSGPRKEIASVASQRPNALLLSIGRSMGASSVQPAFDFFTKDITFYDASQYLQEIDSLMRMPAGDTRFADLGSLLAGTDTGITGMRTVELPVSNSVVQLLAGEGVGNTGRYAFDPKAQKVRTLHFLHKGEDGANVDFEMRKESQGTLASLSFFSLALRQLSRPTLSVIDEIDTSLHPDLVAEFVSLFTDPVTNPHGSQLLFTTHDVSLIDDPPELAALKADQVWLTEKADDGSSSVYPITDMTARGSENIGRKYRAGAYGAVPFPEFHQRFARIINREGE